MPYSGDADILSQVSQSIDNVVSFDPQRVVRAQSPSWSKWVEFMFVIGCVWELGNFNMLS